MRMADATILVVDDEPALLEIFSIWLKRQGAAVVQAKNGVEALKILTTQKVDALVSDMRMPIMDGLSLVRGIHELKLSLPSIIFVSGFNDVPPRVLYSLGVEAMLPKPLARQQLLDALQSSLQAREDHWLNPLPEPPVNNLSLDFASLDEAIAAKQFSLGRGGCCLVSRETMTEGPLSLHLGFTADGFSLEGQGIVRWYDNETRRVGIEFVYLEPPCRTWVFQRVHDVEVQSFIPLC